MDSTVGSRARGAARRLSLAFLAPLLLSGCDFPFDPWGGERDFRPDWPQLFLDLSWGDPYSLPSAADTLSPTLRLHGQLMLDRMPEGKRRGVQRAELILAGRPVSPRVADDGWSYAYEATVPATWEGMRDSVLVVEPPVLEGITATPRVLRFPLWTREGGAEVVILPGVDPVLHLSAPSSAASDSVSTTWNVQVSGTGGSFGMSGAGRPPTAIRIPAENLPGSSTGARYTAVLEIMQTTPTIGPLQRSVYPVGAWLRTRMQWRLRLASP